MPIQLISYDLMTPGKDYARLHKAIEALGSAWHCLESTWMVVTELGSAAVRDQLVPHMDANDRMLVVRLEGDWATRKLDKVCSEWLSENLRR